MRKPIAKVMALAVAMLVLVTGCGAPSGPITEAKVLEWAVKAAARETKQTVMSFSILPDDDVLLLRANSDPDSYGNRVRVDSSRAVVPESTTTFQEPGVINPDTLDYDFLAGLPSRYDELAAPSGVPSCPEASVTVQGTFTDEPIVDLFCGAQTGEWPRFTFVNGELREPAAKQRSEAAMVGAIEDFQTLAPSDVAEVAFPYTSFDMPYVAFRTTYLGIDWPGRVVRVDVPNNGYVWIRTSVYQEDLAYVPQREKRLAEIPETTFKLADVDGAKLYAAAVEAGVGSGVSTWSPAFGWPTWTPSARSASRSTSASTSTTSWTERSSSRTETRSYRAETNRESWRSGRRHARPGKRLWCAERPDQ